METAPLLTDLGEIPDGGKAVFVTTSDDTRIRVAHWDFGKKRTAFIFQGRTEYIEKYRHMIALLIARDFNIVAIDWRGQGLSDRPDGRTDRGHVDHFHDYQKDIAAMLALPQIADMGDERYLFAHSMGGCIGLRAIAEGLALNAAVFSSPMWGLKHADLLGPVVNTVSLAARPFNAHKNLFPGTKPEFYVQTAEFEGNNITNDPVHWQMMFDHLTAYPELGLGGPTTHWVAQAAREMASLRKAEISNIPMLVMVAEEETVVDPAAIVKRVPTLPDARLEHIAGAKHEIWMEKPVTLTRLWSRTDAFLSDIFQ